MPQASLADYVGSLDKVGLLTRISEEKRVDELPALMEANPDTAILVEHVKDCAFPFFASGYGVRPIGAAGHGQTVIECDHDGWPAEHNAMATCNTLWGVLMGRLKEFSETGKPHPAFT